MGGARKLDLRKKLIELSEITFNSAKSALRNRHSLWKIIAGVVIALGVLLTLFLAGNVPPQNIQIVDGMHYIAGTYAETPNPTVGYTNNGSSWTLGSQLGSAQVTTTSVATLSGTFSPSSKPSSVEMTKDLFANLESYPIMFAQVEVTAGVGYGLRFYTTVDGKSIPIWNNSDILNHRIGTGEFEDIQVNMALLSKMNTGVTAQNVTQLQMYVERVPSTTSTPFKLVLENLEFLDYNLIPFDANGSYHSVYFSFDNLPSGGPSYALNRIDLDLQLSAAPGTRYEIFQLNGSSARSGAVFDYSQAIATYDYSLYPKGTPEVFSDNIPPTGNFSIVVVALSGEITQAKLQNVSFVFTPSDPVSVIPNALGWYLFLIFFLFLLPLSVALFIFVQYKRGEDFLKPWHVVLAVAVGIVCRLALAPVTAQPFDLNVYATSARGWFEFGVSNASLGPTLPFTFFLYWIPYSFYALLLMGGFKDFTILGHQTGFVESIFLKGFPIISDLFVCYLLLKYDYGKMGKVLALSYLLNPLSIYISSVWGQYEAATASFLVLGFLFLLRQEDGETKQDFKASIAFVISALIELVGLIPLAFLFMKSSLSKPFKILAPLLVLCPIALLFVYPPESHVLYLISAASVGASSTLLFSQPHTPYTIISNFPWVEAYHPLILLLALLAGVFVWRKRFDLKSMVSFTFGAFIIFLLFAAQEPQWWLFLIPLGIIYAMVSENYGIAGYMMIFGTMVAFLILTFTQGSGYILFGNAQLNVIPAIENARHGVDIYTTTTTVGALLIGVYLVAGDKLRGKLPAIVSSAILTGTLLLSFYVFSILGATL